MMNRMVIAVMAMGGLLLLTACAFSPRTAYQFMDQRGFDGPGVSAFIQMGGGDMKVLTHDVPAILEAMRHSTMVSSTTIVPSCVIYLNTGSSTAMQNMSLHIADSGNGYIEYMGSKSFFAGATLRGFCATEFSRSKPFSSGFPLPMAHFDYYIPVPGRASGNHMEPLRQYFDLYLPLPEQKRR